MCGNLPVKPFSPPSRPSPVKGEGVSQRSPGGNMCLKLINALADLYVGVAQPMNVGVGREVKGEGRDFRDRPSGLETPIQEH